MSDIDTLARTLYGEARGEGRTGMTAVASVVMNRVDHPRWWGHDVEGVCRTPWQFSCWNANDPNLPKLLRVDTTDGIFCSAMTIAAEAVGRTLQDPTNGATSYYDVSIPPPRWAKGREPCATIGRLIFFKDE